MQGKKTNTYQWVIISKQEYCGQGSQGTLYGNKALSCSWHIMCSVRILTTITSNIDLPLDRYVIFNIPAAGERVSVAASGQGVGVVCVGTVSVRSFVLFLERGLLDAIFNDEQRGKGKSIGEILDVKRAQRSIAKIRTTFIS